MSRSDVSRWSEKEKDYAAGMVLAVVREVVSTAGQRRRVPRGLEPTGIRVSPDVAEAVRERSA